MNKSLHVLGVCLAMLVGQSSYAQCPSTYYTLAGTDIVSAGDGTTSPGDPNLLIDGNVNTAMNISSSVPLPTQSATVSVTVTFNGTISANTYLYLKADNLAGVAIEAYNGATLISAPADISVTTKNVYGFSFFEILSTQSITDIKITYTNNQPSQTRKLYELYAGTQCSSPLPVSLASFGLKPLSTNAVRVDWATSMERDNDYFVVERSKDLVQFETVARVKAQEGTQSHTYTLVDDKPYLGTSYYRLTQTDLNGKTVAFEAKSIVLRTDLYGVFPNPVTNDRFTLRLDEPQTAEVTLYSTDGRLLPILKTASDEGLLMIKTTRKLTTGVYFLTVKERAQTRTHRVIIN